MRAALVLLALGLVSVALWALAIAKLGASCPAESSFSCLALVRPSVSELGPFSVTGVLVLGALGEALAALLVARKSASARFRRDVALATALGAGFALGIQPLSLLVTRRACLVCLLALATQLALAFSFARIAEARRGPLGVFFLALAVTFPLAFLAGSERRRGDEARLARLAPLERQGARLVLIERAGCPYCEALVLDVLAREPVLTRLAKTGLERVAAAPGEGAPVLVARDPKGRELLRETGFSPDPATYEAVLAAAER